MTEIIPRAPVATEATVPPQALEAERAILAAMLLDNEAVARAIEQIDSSVFYRVAHQKVFDAMSALFSRNEKVDLITLAEELRKRGELEAVGGGSGLAQILEYAATSANLDQHVRIVHGKAVLRSLIRASTEIQQECFAGHDETASILDRAEQRIFQITDQRVRQGFISMKELMMPTMKHIEELAERKALVTGVPSGYEDLDKMTAGFQKSDLVIIAGRPSMGKCLAHDSELVLDDGSVVTIEELHRSHQGRVGTLRSDLRLDRAAPSATLDDGMKPVFEVTTRLGRRVESTWPHPFLTLTGWKPLAELAVGDRVAVPRALPVFGTAEMRECEVKLLGYLIGDGGLTGCSPCFTNGNPTIAREFEEAVEEFGGCVCRSVSFPGRTPTFAVVAHADGVAARRSELAERLDLALTASGRSARSIAAVVGVAPASLTHWRQGVCVPDPERFERMCVALAVEPSELAPAGVSAARHNAPNAISRWLEAMGLAGKAAAAKHVPAPVFRLPRGLMALFLNRLFATDGWATVLASGQPQLGYASVSERLARQVHHLLLRFGILSKLRARTVAYLAARRPSWQIDVTDSASIRRFVDEIGIFGKEAAVASVREALDRRGARTNVDLVPIEIWDLLERAKGELSWAGLAERSGVEGSNLHVRRRLPSRARLERFARGLGDAELEAIARSDVYWDEIVSIVPKGSKQVYDLTIPETHNFVANDVCVHNTSFALNVAENAAIQHGKNVAVLSLEMSKEQIALRLLCSQSEVPLYKVRSGHLSESEFRRLVNLTGGLYKAGIMIDDTAAPTVLEIRAKCRRLRAENRLDMVLIDYLQLIRGGGRVENRTQEISQITRALKGLAKELDIPILALSQLSRAPEARGQSERRPQLSDLRESGSIEQDADVVLFVFREEMYKRDDPTVKGRADIIIAKQRNGPVGDVKLTFLHEFTKFVPYSAVMPGETDPGF